MGLEYLGYESVRVGHHVGCDLMKTCGHIIYKSPSFRSFIYLGEKSQRYEIILNVAYKDVDMCPTDNEW